MDSIIEIITPLLTVLSGIITGILGAGPLGAILLAVIAGVAGIAGIWAYNKYKAWKYSNAHKKEQEQADKDHEQIIKDNQGMSTSDKNTFKKSELEKEILKKKLENES